MKLIIETDIGHDPDDLFAICYLVATGKVDIQAICISPGDPDQIAIARLVCERLGLNIPVGAATLGREKLSSGSIHHSLLERYGKPLYAEADGLGHEILSKVCNEYTEAFIIGPATSVGRYLETHWGICRATMQGGFVPYGVYRPTETLAKFEGKGWMPTFNLNADRVNGQCFLNKHMPRQMVGKNVCHTIQFDKARFAQFSKPINAASELFCEAATLYFEKHESKKFHDPTAAVCHLHPKIGHWIKGKTIRREGGWTTVPGEDDVLVDIDRDALWNHLCNWT